MLHELWDEDDEQTFVLAGPLGDSARSQLGPSARLTWTVEAPSHLVAMQRYHEHMGRGSYESLRPDLDRVPYRKMGWEWTFQTRIDGQIDAELVGDWHLFNEALADSVSSLPPRGEAGAGPSTYWVDVALTALSRLEAAGCEGLISGGNWTSFWLVDERVEARNDYGDPDDAEAITARIFHALLAEWRRRIARSESMRELPHTYRRNPSA